MPAVSQEITSKNLSKIDFSVATFQHRSTINSNIEMKEEDCDEDKYVLPVHLDGPGQPKNEQGMMELCQEVTENSETFKLCMMGLMNKT